MNQPTLKTAFKLIMAVIITFGLSLSLQSILAQYGNWINPTCSPPLCNVPAPVNVGTSTQYKAGGIDFGDSLIAGDLVADFGTSTLSIIKLGGVGVSGDFTVNNELLYTSTSKKTIGMGTTNNEQARLTVDMKNIANMEGIHIRRAAGAPSYFSYLNIRNESDQPIFQVHESGNVGIGVSIPGAKLDVNGTLKISGGNPGQGKVLMSNATGLASWVATNTLGISGGGGQWTTTGNNISNLNTGSVGIGGVNSNAKLNILGTGNPFGLLVTNDASNVSISAISVSGSGIVGYSQYGKGVVGTSNTGIGGYFSSVSGYALITESGKVGIKTPTPAATLDVNGVTIIRGDLYVFGSKSGTCTKVAYTLGGTQTCPMYYFISTIATPSQSGDMICCKVDNP